MIFSRKECICFTPSPDDQISGKECDNVPDSTTDMVPQPVRSFQNVILYSHLIPIILYRTNRAYVEEQQTLGVVRRCSQCQQSDMVLKRKPDGNFMVGCLGYPLCRNVVWLPGSISEAIVTPNPCSSCLPGPVFLIQFKFRRSEIPPNYNAGHLGRKSFMRTPSKVPSSVAYPFDFIKPCGVSGGVTLKDNQHILTPPPKPKEVKEDIIYPTSAFSCKPVVGQTANQNPDSRWRTLQRYGDPGSYV